MKLITKISMIIAISASSGAFANGHGGTGKGVSANLTETQRGGGVGSEASVGGGVGSETSRSAGGHGGNGVVDSNTVANKGWQPPTSNLSVAGGAGIGADFGQGGSGNVRSVQV